MHHNIIYSFIHINPLVVLGVTVPVATLILIGLIILVVILLMLTVRKFKKQHTSFVSIMSKFLKESDSEANTVT